MIRSFPENTFIDAYAGRPQTSFEINRARLHAGAAALCALAMSGLASATPPAAPDVIYWSAAQADAVREAHRPRGNWYEIWFKANDGSTLVKLGSTEDC